MGKALNPVRAFVSSIVTTEILPDGSLGASCTRAPSKKDPRWMLNIGEDFNIFEQTQEVWVAHRHTLDKKYIHMVEIYTNIGRFVKWCDNAK